MLYSGLDLMLYNSSGTAILGACKGVEINVEQDVDEVVSVEGTDITWTLDGTSGTVTFASAPAAGTNTLTITISNLVTATTLSNTPSMVGTTYQCRFYNGTDTNMSALLIGTAICRQAKITEQKGSIAKGSFVFQGTGPLT